ncbi:unnamed protein product [Urochloa humidicola]
MGCCCLRTSQGVFTYATSPTMTRWITATKFFEEVPVDAVFQKDEMVDMIGVTKGKGYEGVVTCSQDPQGSQQGCLASG